MTRITKRAVDALQPPEEGQAFLWDGELRGLGVRVMASGVKSFILQYRNDTGRSRRIVIGRYGALTVEQARAKAKIELGSIAGGADPAYEKQGAKGKPTVSDLCNWYLKEAEAGRILGRRNRPIKASTLESDLSRIETHIKPLLGRRLAHTLTIADVEGMQADIAAGKTAKPRGKGRGGVTTGGSGVAARALSTLQSILGHAARLGKIDGHPSRGARKLAGNKKDRRLSKAELVELGRAIRLAEQTGEHPVALAAVRLMLLTGFRISEVQGLQHDWFDAEHGFIRFPDTKSDSQIRALGPVAIELIEQQPKLINSPYVFPADIGDGHFTASKACLARLCHMAGIKGVTPHTLRHTFGSVAGDLGFSELTIRAMLGHASRGVTQGYVHIDEALRLGVTRTSDEIALLLDPRLPRASAAPANKFEASA